ncbi:MAG: MFS transporter [Spirochaetes bacterium]|nr:MAG: MFS transporter [Spirochaetota bacterium]
MKESFPRDLQYYKFSLYGFLKNLKFFDPFIILFFREMGLSFLEIGTLFSIREIATNVFEIPTGIIADSFGRRMSMVFSFISYIISFLMFFFFPNFIIYIFAMIIFASGEAFRTGTHKAMILEYLKINNLTKYKVDYYGHTRGWSQFGSAISSLIAAALVFYSGSYKIIFLASIVPYVADLILMLTYPKELDGEIMKEREGGKKKFIHQIAATFKDFIFIFKSKYILKALLNSAFYDGAFKTVKDYLQPILKQYAIMIPIFLYMEKEKRISIVIGFVYFILFLLTSFSSRNSDRISKRMRSLPTAINVAYLVGMGLIAITGFLIHLNLYIPGIIIFVVFYMLENIKRPMNLGYLSDLISSRVMASGLSGESQLKTVVVAILSPIMGFFADKIGVGGALMVIAGILLIIFPLASVKRIEE